MIYLPKQIVPLQPTKERPLLFLAGPIRGGGDWQSEMAYEILAKEPEVLIACPSRWDESHFLSDHFHMPFTEAENRQLDWENHYLNQAGRAVGVAGCVIFWLASESRKDPHPGPEPYAMDTRREVGKFTAYAEMTDIRIVVGGHLDFHGLSAIVSEFANALGPYFHFHATIHGAVSEALEIARR